MRIGLFLLLIGALGCRCRPSCDARNCASGCCNPLGVCRSGLDDDACGSGGILCTDCTREALVCYQSVCEIGDWSPPDAGPWFDAGYGSVPMSDLCRATSEATCLWFARCDRLDPSQRADCIALGSFDCPQSVYDALLARQRTRYDAVKAGSCMNEIAASECTGGSSPAGGSSDACRDFAQGAGALGTSCPPDFSAVCAGGYCKGSTCPGTCTGFAPINAPCAEDEECGPDAYCSGEATRRCLAYQTAGQDCTPPERCLRSVCDLGQGRCIPPGTLPRRATCSVSSACLNGLYCRRSGGFPVGTCEPWERQGGTCVGQGVECEPGLSCRIAPGETVGSCQPRSGPGESCTRGSDHCRAGLLCSATGAQTSGVCLVYGSEGQRCDPAARNCKVTLYCDPPSATCQKLPRLGQACADGSAPWTDCFDGYCAFSGTLKCEARKTNGSPCVVNVECASAQCEEASRACQPQCTAF